VIAILMGCSIVGLVFFLYLPYRRDLRRARQRIAVGSEVLETACGQIELAVVGDGAPVLFVHGAGGGYDQGLDIGRPLVQRGFRIIAPSRFGYLRTPVPADASPAAQADAYTCLLDALGIQRVSVVGLSAGAPSAMQFALRHPERTAALVLMVPAAYPTAQAQRAEGAAPEQTSAFTRTLFDIALRSDFLFWVFPRVAPGAALQALLATPPAALESASPEERARAREVLDHLLPFSARRLGVLNDGRVTPHLPRYALEKIASPTLIFSTADDGYGTYEGARYSAEHIPGARLIVYPSGGHILLGHQSELIAETATFLRGHAK